MTHLAPGTPPQRRRGAALEEALLTAAWEELVSSGYGNLTLESVAARAGTSRPVLARRWPDKQDLVRAAITRVLSQNRMSPPETGSLREDLLTLLRRLNRAHSQVMTAMSILIGDYYDATGVSPKEIRAMLTTGHADVLDTVLREAADRGEIDPSRISARIRSLPFTLLRDDLLLGMREASEEDLFEIVDRIFLPLVTPTGA